MAFDFEGSAQHRRIFRNSDPGSDDRGKRGLESTVHSVGEFCDNSCDRRKRSLLHAPTRKLDALHRIRRICTEKVGFPGATPNPVAWHSVPECEDDYDWPSPCSHSRQCYSRRLSVSPRLTQVAEGELGGGRPIGQDNSVSRNCDSRSFTIPTTQAFLILA